MSVMEHSRHNAKWTSGIRSDKFPVFYAVLVRINFKAGIHGPLKTICTGRRFRKNFGFSPRQTEKYLGNIRSCAEFYRILSVQTFQDRLVSVRESLLQSLRIVNCF